MEKIIKFLEKHIVGSLWDFELDQDFLGMTAKAQGTKIILINRLP